MLEVEKKISELKKDISKLEREKRGIELMNTYQRIAYELHEKFCKSDHVEQCGWFYEIKDGTHNWDGSTHKDQLEKAKKLLNAGYQIVDLEKLDEIGFRIRV